MTSLLGPCQFWPVLPGVMALPGALCPWRMEFTGSESSASVLQTSMLQAVTDGRLEFTVALASGSCKLRRGRIRPPRVLWFIECGNVQVSPVLIPALVPWDWLGTASRVPSTADTLLGTFSLSLGQRWPSGRACSPVSSAASFQSSGVSGVLLLLELLKDRAWVSVIPNPQLTRAHVPDWPWDTSRM